MESTVKGETRRGGDDKERDYDDQESWFRMMLSHQIFINPVEDDIITIECEL